MLLPASVERRAVLKSDGIASRSRTTGHPRLQRPQSPATADVVWVVVAAGAASAAEPDCVEADDSSWPSEHSARADCSRVETEFREASDGLGGSDGLALGRVMVASGSILAAASVGAVRS